jgi:hypothetical protein
VVNHCPIVLEEKLARMKIRDIDLLNLLISKLGVATIVYFENWPLKDIYMLGLGCNPHHGSDS